jgi:ABC-type sugar transport system substrate-binding protein
MYRSLMRRNRRTFLRSILASGLSVLAGPSDGVLPLRVTFITPSSVGDPFWDRFTEFMRAVAQDLGVQLEVRYANVNRFNATKLALESIRARPRPDCLMYVYQIGQGMEVLKAAEVAKVRSFIINTDVTDTDREAVGLPREKFKYWIGHMHPNDVSAGGNLAAHLVEAARQGGKLGADGRVHVVALNGLRDSPAAGQRLQGLEQAMRAHPETVLHQLVYADWNRQTARYQSAMLLKRYPETRVVWAASDSIALGAVEGIGDSGLKAGSDVLVGGIDWAVDGIRAVRDGQMLISLGGHFMDGGWSLILAHDFLRGTDFASTGVTIRSDMQAITQANVESLFPLLAESHWESFGFRQFSKVHNPRLREYDFSRRAVLRSMPKA